MKVMFFSEQTHYTEMWCLYCNDISYGDNFSVSGDFLNCEGSGLYVLQSSCKLFGLFLFRINFLNVFYHIFLFMYNLWIAKAHLRNLSKCFLLA